MEGFIWPSLQNFRHQMPNSFMPRPSAYSNFRADNSLVCVGSAPRESKNKLENLKLTSDKAACYFADQGEIGKTSHVLGVRNEPNIYDDARSLKAAIKIPLKSYKHFENLSSKQLHCSFRANNCTSCFEHGRNHGIGDKNVFMITDQFGPASIGLKGQCVPTIRFQNPDFNDIIEALEAQKKCGFKPKAGSIFIVNINSILGRVGCEKYWRDFDLFSDWLKNNFDGRAMPMLSPYSNQLPSSMILNLHTWYTTLIARHDSDQEGQEMSLYKLWKPLDRTFSFINMPKRAFEATFLDTSKNNNSGIIKIPEIGWLGLELGVGCKIPDEIEYTFLGFLSEELSLILANSKSSFPNNHDIIDGIIPDIKAENQAAHSEIEAVSNFFTLHNSFDSTHKILLGTPFTFLHQLITQY